MEKLLVGESARWGHGHQLGLPEGEGPGLVDDERVDLPQDLDGFGVLEQDAHRGPLAGRDHDGHGRGKPRAQGQAMIKTATELMRA